MFKKLFSIIFALSAVILFTGIRAYSDEASKPFTWRGVEVTEFPYVIKEYPKGMSVKADGKDILAGETVPGVSYKGGTLFLDNADIEKEIRVTGVPNLNVSLTGDNSVNRIIFTGAHMTVIGYGTLTVGKIDSSNQKYNSFSYYSPFITISENTRIYGKTDYENDTELNSPIRFSSIHIEDNGYLECADIRGSDLKLRDNARVKTSHCNHNEEISLSGNSVLEVVTDYEKYSQLEMGYELGRCLYGINRLTIRDDARLSIECDTKVYGIFCYWSNNEKITVSDNGILEISGSSWYGVSLNESAFGTLEMNGNSQVRISGFDIGLMAKRIDINGGKLDIHSNECALQINDINSPYSSFESVLAINGDIVSQSCDWEVTDFTKEEMEQYNWYYDILRSADSGEPLKDFSITVAPKKDSNS